MFQKLTIKIKLIVTSFKKNDKRKEEI